MKQKIRNLLLKLLGIDDTISQVNKIIAENKSLIAKYERLHESYVELLSELRNNQRAFDEAYSLISKTNVAIDHHPISNSWAVVSIDNGNDSYVKFFPLPSDPKRMIEILRDWSKAAHINIDSDPFGRQIINREFYRK